MGQQRPDRIDYYMGLAVSVSARAECVGLTVGAVLVRDNRVVSTGYNGAPEGFGNCTDGGVCPRCDNRGADGFTSGTGYDLCVCVHAETNAIAAAARYGLSADGGAMYVTHQPCITCAKELIQAGVQALYYCHELPITHDNTTLLPALQRTRERLMRRLRAVDVTDVAKVADHQLATIERFRGGGKYTPPQENPAAA